MQRIDFPTSAFRGSACARCGRADRLIDTDVNIDYEGGIALCAGCIADAALMAGFTIDQRGAERIEKAERDAAHWEKRALDAERLLSSVQNAVNRTKNLPKPKPKPVEADA